MVTVLLVLIYVVVLYRAVVVHRKLLAIRQYQLNLREYLAKEHDYIVELDQRLQALEQVKGKAPSVSVVPTVPASTIPATSVNNNDTYSDLLSALSNLGFKKGQAKSMADKAMAENPHVQLPDLIRAALKQIGPIS